MSYTFRKAVRENSSVLVGLAGHTGTGKTKGALRLARGLAGPQGRIVMLDTESGRGTHYADQHDYDYAEIKPPFSPATYQAAIVAAEAAKYDVVIIDSMSHEWAGDGGCCDMQAEALERMSQGDSRRMERLTAPAWKEPKVAHKKLMSRLLQSRASLIFCLRAEPKIKFVKVRGDDGRERTVIEDLGFQPICEKSFMFEMTLSFMIDERHLPVPIKLGEHFRPFFPLDQPVTEASGKALGEWARGGAVGMTPSRAEGSDRPPVTPSQGARETGAQGAAPANGGPSPEPDERTRLLTAIDALAGEMKLSKDDRRDGWNTYLGRGVTREKAEVAGLADLLKWMRTRAGKMEATP